MRTRLAMTPPETEGALSTPAPSPDRSAWRLDDIAATLGVSRRTVERLRSSGRFPRPDAKVGRMPLWRPETIRRWVAEGGKA